MNKPFGWYIAGMIFEGKDSEQEAKDFENGLSKDGFEEKAIPLYTQEQLEEARKLGMQQERALWNLSESTQEIMNTHLVKELTDEEIQEIAHGFGAIGWMGDTTYEFARAILKKAQEK